MADSVSAEAMPAPGAASPVGPLSVRAYARHRQTSHTAVQRAILKGRLKDSIGIDAHGKAQIFDVALADAEWAANTDLSHAPGYVKERQPVGAAQVGEISVPRVPGGVSSLSEASAREKHWKAKQAELEYLESAGLLVEAEPLEARMVELITQCKTKLLGVPSKAKHALPHLTHSDVRVIDELIRQALEDLADAPVVGADRAVS